MSDSLPGIGWFDAPGVVPVARRASITPEREALVDRRRGRSWSYREYDDLVSTYADAIRSRDAGTVAVLAPPSPAVAALTFVAFRGECRLALLHQADARPQHEEKLERVDAEVLVCAPETLETALAVTDEGATCPVASVGSELDGSLETVAGGRARSQTPGTDGQGELVLFTSGTTGEPRGVRITPVNCFASAVGSAFRLGLDAAERWLAPLSMSHAGGLLPAYRCALYGTTLVLDGPFDPDATAATLADAEITTVSLVPTMLERLFAAEWEPPEHLAAVLLGGAPAEDELIERCEERGVPVYPTYGATETASQVATATPSEAFEHVGTVGRPLLFNDLAVLDESGDPCGPGDVGEIVVAGPTVTPGYLDAAATDRAFDERGRLHTGDCGYCDSEGRLWVTGRVDDRILTGGEIVQPGTVESVIRSIEGVDAAAVVGLSDPEWGERVGAVVVPASGGGVTLDTIRAHCREHLADHERPKTLALAEGLPRTASGTVDRQAVQERLRHASTE